MNANPTALVTGASSGFGEAIAKRLASLNYNLIILARRKERLDALKQEILNSNSNINIKIIVADVRDFNVLSKEITPIVQNTTIDVLVNNAGLALGLSSIDKEDVSDWDTMIDTNIKGLLYVTRIVLPFMIKAQSGYIINISSIAGKEVYPKGNVYCASKHAVDSIGESLRIDTAEFGIRVTNINPGAAETEFSLVRFKGDKEKAKIVYNGFKPLNNNDIADTVQWLLSRPAHVNINEITIMPTDQPKASLIHKK